MYTLLVPVALLAALAASFSVLFRVNIGFTLPVAAMAMALWVYFCCFLFGSLSLGVITLPVSVAALAVVAALRCKNSLIPLLRKHLLTWGAVAFPAFFTACVFFARLHGGDPLFWDEYAHWGQMVEEMIRLDAFYTVDGTTLNYHNNYPPIVAVWEALCCVMPSWAYSGKIVYASLWLLQGLMLLPFIEMLNSGIEERRIAVGIFSIILLFCITVICVPAFDRGEPAFWKSMYADAVFGLAAGYTLWAALKIDGSIWSNASATIALCFLALIKQMAILFVVIGLVIILWRVCSGQFQDGKRTTGKAMLPVIVTVLAVVTTIVSWRMVCDASNLSEVSESRWNVSMQSIASFFSIMSGEGGEAYQRAFVPAFVKALFVTPVSQKPLIAAPFFAYSAICIGLVACFTFVTRAKDGFARGVVITQVISVVLYTAAMLFLYLSSGFSEKEIRTLASFERYMGTCLTAVMFLTTMFFAETFRLSKGDKRYLMHFRAFVVFVVVCCSVVPYATVGIWGASSDIAYSRNQNMQAKADASFLAGHLVKQSNVYILDQSRSDQQSYALRIAYFANGHVILDRNSGLQMFMNSVIDPGLGIIQGLVRDDYLYVKKINGRLSDALSSVFGVRLADGVLYRIDIISGKFALTAVGARE